MPLRLATTTAAGATREEEAWQKPAGHVLTLRGPDVAYGLSAGQPRLSDSPLKRT